MARARRGISPVLATLILIVIAVVAGLLVYAWVMGWMGGRTPTGMIRVDKVIRVDEGVYRIVVTNVGDTKVVIDKVTLIFGGESHTVDDDISEAAGNQDTVEVGPGESVTLYHNTTWTSPPDVYDEVKVIIYTTAGDTFEATLTVESP